MSRDNKIIPLSLLLTSLPCAKCTHFEGSVTGGWSTGGSETGYFEKGDRMRDELNKLYRAKQIDGFHSEQSVQQQFPNGAEVLSGTSRTHGMHVSARLGGSFGIGDRVVLGTYATAAYDTKPFGKPVAKLSSWKTEESRIKGKFSYGGELSVGIKIQENLELSLVGGVSVRRLERTVHSDYAHHQAKPADINHPNFTCIRPVIGVDVKYWLNSNLGAQMSVRAELGKKTYKHRGDYGKQFPNMDVDSFKRRQDHTWPARDVMYGQINAYNQAKLKPMISVSAGVVVRI